MIPVKERARNNFPILYLGLDLLPRPASCIGRFSLSLLVLQYGLLLFAAGGASAAMPVDHVVPMTEKSARTFYVQGEIAGVGAVDFLVDTGSSYNTINEHSLAMLQKQGRASFVRDLIGILANGQRKRVAVYRLDIIRLGDNCELHDVEAAVFPGRTRHILGLSGLRKAGNFTFSFEPPQLTLSSCQPVAKLPPNERLAAVQGTTLQEER